MGSQSARRRDQRRGKRVSRCQQRLPSLSARWSATGPPAAHNSRFGIGGLVVSPVSLWLPSPRSTAARAQREAPRSAKAWSWLPPRPRRDITPGTPDARFAPGFGIGHRLMIPRTEAQQILSDLAYSPGTTSVYEWYDEGEWSTGITFSPDGNFIASGFKPWQLASLGYRNDTENCGVLPCIKLEPSDDILIGIGSAIETVGFTPDGKRWFQQQVREGGWAEGLEIVLSLL